MWDTEEDYEETEEAQVEYDYENPENLEETFMDVADLPPIEGAEFIAKIEDPEVREREVEAAEKLYERGEELKRKLESGEISQGRYEHERGLHGIKAQRAISRWQLAEGGMTYDKMGDTMEDWNHIPDEKLDLDDYRKRIKDRAEKMGPEAAKDLADRMRKEDELSRDAHDIIKRQVQQARKEGK